MVYLSKRTGGILMFKEMSMNLMCKGLIAKENLKRKMFKKRSGDKAVIVELLFVAIAVVLIILFKDQIYALVGKVSQHVNKVTDGLFS